MARGRGKSDPCMYDPEMFVVIIFVVTGYRYWFPFLRDSSNGAKYLSGLDGYKMERLYMRILHVDDPTLAFIGITNHNLSPGIDIEHQAQWYAKYVKGDLKISTPTREEMEREVHTVALIGPNTRCARAQELCIRKLSCSDGRHRRHYRSTGRICYGGDCRCICVR